MRNTRRFANGTRWSGPRGGSRRVRPGFAGAAALLLAITAIPCTAQVPAPPPVEPIKLDGPRIGFTFISPQTVENIDDYDIRQNLERFPFISQVGWQWERRFFTTPGGGTGVTEIVMLLGAVEQSIVLPSLTWLVGFRTSKGAEFGLGPNVSLTGGSWVLAGGVTLTSGGVNFPINMGLAMSPNGSRVTLLGGFNVASGPPSP